jgi:ATP-dependent Clp protease ATP-binding subunit ClpX
MNSNNEPNIDQMIRLQLLVNPELNMSYCQKVVQKLSGMTHERKKELLLKLQGGGNLFRQKVSSCDKDFQIRDSFCEMVQKHVEQWESLFGKVSLNDINKVQLATGLQLKNLSEAYVTPESLFLVGKEYIKGQDDMLRSIALQVYMHKMRIEHPDLKLPKTNILVYGPSGCGKTYAVQVMTRILDIPVGRLNCAILTQEGIVGYNFNDVFTDLYIENERNLEKVANSIIVADEADKLFGPGYYNPRIRNEILPALDDDANIYFNSTKSNNSNYIHVSTRNISFILSGVFREVVAAAHRRKNPRKVGFGVQERSNMSETEINGVSVEDFRACFNSPELSGRIGSYVAANELKAEDLSNILLHAEGSPLESFINFFHVHGRNLELTEEAAAIIADHALEKGLGVRGMKSILSHIMRDEMQKVGRADFSKNDFVINKEYVEYKMK